MMMRVSVVSVVGMRVLEENRAQDIDSQPDARHDDSFVKMDGERMNSRLTDSPAMNKAMPPSTIALVNAPRTAIFPVPKLNRAFFEWRRAKA